MTHEEKVKLFKTYVLMQMIVYSIDELIESKIALQDIKMIAKQLSERIIKKHGQNIKTIWDIQTGEKVNVDTSILFDTFIEEIATASTDQVSLFNEIITGIKNNEITFEAKT